MRYREGGEECRENDGCGVERFFRAAFFEFSEVSGARGEGEAGAFRLHDDGRGEEDAYRDKRVECEIFHG